MEVKDTSAQKGANVQQWGADSPAAHNTWRVPSNFQKFLALFSCKCQICGCDSKRYGK
ncbi:hypothetical protein [Porcipelethomonas sp.]|uniref:hypothetical protein n=1 Tax=Porcipelethomonas sp. TaxID=2981675 RepID=UPI003EF9C05F